MEIKKDERERESSSKLETAFEALQKESNYHNHQGL